HLRAVFRHGAAATTGRAQGGATAAANPASAAGPESFAPGHAWIHPGRSQRERDILTGGCHDALDWGFDQGAHRKALGTARGRSPRRVGSPARDRDEE